MGNIFGDRVPRPINSEALTNRGMKERHQLVIANITAKIAADYRPVLEDAHYSAWNLKVPTQAVVDGLTTRVQNKISDIAQDLKEQFGRHNSRLSTLQNNIFAYMDQFGLPIDEPNDKQAGPELVSWASFQEPFEQKGTSND